MISNEDFYDGGFDVLAKEQSKEARPTLTRLGIADGPQSEVNR